MRSSYDRGPLRDVVADLAPGNAPRRHAGRPARRLKLWQIPSNWLCPVVGTCLTPADIQQVCKRCAIRFQDGTYDYVIHGYLVGEASTDGRAGREINKLLDHKYRAIVSKVADEPDEERLANLWDDHCQRGLVAGAYWAMISQAHVPEELKTRAFGEIHILSHFMGEFNRQSARELWQAERENHQLADRLASHRRRAQADVAARDHRIAELEQELRATRNQLASSYQRLARPAPRSSASWQIRLDRGQCRLSAVRACLRASERENQRLAALVDALADVAAPVASPSLAARVGGAAPDAEGRCILYVGGRCHLVPHLRARAEARCARLLHHDGGRGEALQALESLVDRADIVFCPIDCVSHHACLKAKQLCRRLAKPFVPLRSSSATCFARAIETWHGRQAEGSARPGD